VTQENDGLLDEAEKTGDWDMMKLRQLLTALSPGVLYFSVEQWERWRKQCDRMQKLMHERYAGVLGS
jgi:hypothetical protein